MLGSSFRKKKDDSETVQLQMSQVSDLNMDFVESLIAHFCLGWVNLWECGISGQGNQRRRTHWPDWGGTGESISNCLKKVDKIKSIALWLLAWAVFIFMWERIESCCFGRAFNYFFALQLAPDPFVSCFGRDRKYLWRFLPHFRSSEMSFDKEKILQLAKRKIQSIWILLQGAKFWSL